MSKKRFIILISLLAVAGAVTAGVVLSKNQVTDNEIILFYGHGCPHCVKVEKFIEENNLKSKVVFSVFEVFHNKDNADKLRSASQKCGMGQKAIGVPFLWNGPKGECLVGDSDIIAFFKEKM